MRLEPARAFFSQRPTEARLRADRDKLLRALDLELDHASQDPARVRLNQWLALRSLLERAASQVPGYRRKYLAAGFRPPQLQGWEDLERVPILEKRELRAADPAEWRDPHCAGEVLDTRTSGSSGSPLRMLRTVESLWGSTAHNMALYHEWCAGRPLAHVLYFIDPTEHSIDFALARQLLTTVDESRIHSAFLPIEEQEEILLELEPAFLSSYPSTVKSLAARLNRRNQRLESLELLHLTSESLDLLGEAQLRRAFPRARLLQTYTATEAGLIAFQCREGGGFHPASRRVLLEIVDEQGRATRGSGRVVVTDLGNPASPLIRYAGLEDFARWDESPCPCGRPGPRLAALEGRRMESLRRADGALHPPYALTSALSEVPGVAAYQVIQFEARKLSLRVVADPGSAPPPAELERRLRAVLEEQLGAGLDCQVVHELEIRPEPGSRKLPLIRCLLPEDA